MPGYLQKTPTGYLECNYENPWPGLVTNLPSSQISAGAISSGNAMNVSGRLQPQPSVYTVASQMLGAVTMPTFASGEVVCHIDSLQGPSTQSWFTVIITNVAVYSDYLFSGTTKSFSKVFTFSTAYDTGSIFCSCVIGNALYFSSGNQLGVYALRPTFSVASVEVTNVGGYLTSTPTVVFSDGGGTGAAATATVSSEFLRTVVLSSGGSGYYTAPIVNVNGGATVQPTAGLSLASATAVLSTIPTGYAVQEITANTGVSNFSVSTQGSGYVSPTVAIVGGGGTGAVGTAILSTDGNGYILGISMSSPGRGYTTNPTVEIIDPVGTGATAVCNLFSSTPFISGNFMTTMNERLILGDITGGDGNGTVPIDGFTLGNLGSAYDPYDLPTLSLVGGGGTGASGYATVTSSGQINSVVVGYGTSFSATIPIESDSFGAIIKDLSRIRPGMEITGSVIPLGSTIVSLTPTTTTFTANIVSGSNTITNMSAQFGVIGATLIGAGIPSGTVMSEGINATSLVMSNAALATQDTVSINGYYVEVVISSTTTNTEFVQTIVFTAYGYTYGASGSGYYSEPTVSFDSDSGYDAETTAILSSIPLRASSLIRYPDRVAWSSASAYGYFDPNWGVAPGGYSTLTEARGIVSGFAVFESVGFIGHNGGITEMTTNNTGSGGPFAFYSLWSSEHGVMCRYGSMAQYGTTSCFLSNDNAYSLTPNGLTAIGTNISDLLENQTYNSVNPSVWNGGAYPESGLYGSIVIIEGEMHYLICASTVPITGVTSSASTEIFDFNLANSTWNVWDYSGYSATCPITQAIDNQVVFNGDFASTSYIANDNWLLAGWSTGFFGKGYVHQMTTVNQMVKMFELGNLGTQIFAPSLSVQFRTESPAIARLIQERRLAFEYENLSLYTETTVDDVTVISPVTLSIDWTLYGQQDPTVLTSSTGPALNNTNAFTSSANYYVSGAAGLLDHQIFSWQQDFGTWAGTCTSLNMSTTVPVSLVKITQVSTLPKLELT